MLALPETSERIVSIPDFYRSSVPALALGVPGELGPFDFNWPCYGHAVGILVLPANGVPDTLAGLSLEVRDHHGENLTDDGRGLVLGVAQAAASPCLGLFGRGFRPFALDRIFRPHDSWRFSLKNLTGGAILVSSLAIMVRDLPR